MTITTEWGELRWLVNGELTPGAEQTFGVVRILPGRNNPLHFHPNCEEILYVLAGTCRHSLGDETFTLSPGEAIRVPAGVVHNARCTSDEPLEAVISFSSPDRQTTEVETKPVPE